MQALVKCLNQMPENDVYILKIVGQIQIVTTRFKKNSPRLTHFFKINKTNGYLFNSWILDDRSGQLVIIELQVLIIVKSISLSNHYQLNKLIRSSIMLINKYTPRMYFFLKRQLAVEYKISTLMCNDSMKIKNGVSQGYFFLKRDLVT
jgi:hypothetical protein